LTDNLLSPLIQHADVSLSAESKMPAFVDSFTAPLSVIKALIAYAAKQKQGGFEKRLDELEEVWERFDVIY
jgi:DNA-binding MurR/RpiR family transcriptional regulator